MISGYTVQDANQLPSNLIDALRYCDLDIFPCIHRLLVIGCTLPVTSCEAERSFSALRRTVSYLRSSMSEERLAGLTLMHLHRDVGVETEEVIRQFSETNTRRMFSGSVLLE